MDFVELEQLGKQALEQFPVIKRLAKRVYQIASVAISNERIKSEGNVIRVSPEDGFEYFYGYYDKSPWDVSDRYMICIKVKQTYKSVAPKEPGFVGVLDTKDNNKFIQIGVTHSWNVQQSCMAQWMGPDYCSRIIYNDFRDGKYCSIIYNWKDRKMEKVLPLPVYDVSRDGNFALSLDFNRLHRMRPGYGYSNIPDATKGVLCPDQVCIWKMDIPSGTVTELFKYTDFAAFEPDESMHGAEHKVNHLMISPNCRRFMVLHRWFQKGRKHTRLVTVNVDKTEMYNLSDDVFVSHCYWKNDDEILSFLRKKETGNHYYLMKDKTQEYKMFWPELNTDGHCSYSPDGSLIITDTYPNRKRIASVYLCTEGDNRSRRIARVSAPFRYDNDCRCDLHPRWNRKGNKICIDSVHDGRRGLYIIPVPTIDMNRYDVVANKSHTITVVLATYNGEKYLRDQLDSLLRQKGVHVKILVRDDGSKDGTIAILDEYQNKGFLNWYTGEHLNVQRGYLDLLKHAPETDYYAFCDQDDVWDDDKLLFAVTELDEMPSEKPAIYYCGQRLVDENLKLISTHKIASDRSPHTNFLISNVAGCTAVFNRSLVDAVNSVEPDFILMHDSWLFKVCLALGGNYFADSAAHISYRQHGNNVAGLNGGMKGKLHQVRRYIDVFEIQKQCQNLLICYGNRMVPEYKKLTEEICTYNQTIASRIKMLKRKDIDFKSGSLNFVVKLKIILNKL
ncbi:glycosyltransferase [Faecalicoccus pleomorphus]|uniref:glycosyltransferase n=1 Tax=Faecalicoccus pleomorphus TaxID=1323 RepID=UPI0039F6088A